MFSDKKSKIVIIVVCVLLGFMLTLQFRVTENVKNSSVSLQRANELLLMLKEVTKERNELLVEVDKLKNSENKKVLEKEMQNLQLRAGVVEVHGPGVFISVDDSLLAEKKGENPNLYLIHDDDLLKIVNELWAAGAEAISLNKERLIVTSEIRCAGPTVVVNGHRFTPPYYIKAIGDPNVLETALSMRGGVLETLKFWGIQIKVIKKDEITVPAYKGILKMEHAKVGEEK